MRRRTQMTPWIGAFTLLACQPSSSEVPDTDTSPAETAGSTADPSNGSEAMSTADTSDGEPDTDPGGSDGTGTTGDNSTGDDTQPGPAAECGDGYIDPGEDCDDGVLGNANDKGCLANCQLASCGDEFVWDGVEDCDLGVAENTGAYGGCNEDCTHAPRCGDEVVDHEHGELCDGTSPDGIPCKACRLYEGAKLVFITSVPYPGDLGGLAGADALCSMLADAGGLIPKPEDGDEPIAVPYRAWLSTDEQSVDERFTKHGLPYVTRTGQVIAWSWDELTDPAVLKPQITQSELPQMSVTDKWIWTNTRGDGSLTSSTLHCGGWSIGTLGTDGRVGTTTVDLDQELTPALIEAWTHYTGPSGLVPCGFNYHLYCFEQ